MVLEVLYSLAKRMRCGATLIKSPGAGLAECWWTSLATTAQMIWSRCRREWDTATYAQRRPNREDKFLTRRAKSFFWLNESFAPQAPLWVQKCQHRSESVADRACHRPPSTPHRVRRKVSAFCLDENGRKQLSKDLS